MKTTLLFSAALIAVLAPAARADVRLPALFSDHMVLQRAVSPPVWGWADAGEEVTVSIAGQMKTAKTDGDGRWSLKLDKIDGAGPYTLTVKGRNSLTVTDILAGEVWLASGQSNMAMTVKASRDFDKEQPAAQFPQIRMFTVARKAAREPQAECRGKWEICSPETVGGFSAAAYFFGRELHQKLGAPIGLINSSVGGTPIEAWTSMEVQKATPAISGVASWDRRAERYDPVADRERYDKERVAYLEAAQKAKDEGKPAPRAPVQPVDPRDDVHHPAVLFNGMIAPLVPYAIRGAIWYQGESNAGSEKSGELYGVQLPLMVRDWRNRWNQGDYPFAWVQLPNYKTTAKGWSQVREAMVKSLDLPNTGMSVNIDVGEENDIHPKDKQTIGTRLSLWARAKVYGESIPWSGPMFWTRNIKGGSIEIGFLHADGGLVAKGGDIRGFQICGADKQWRPAVARIEARKVIVSSPDVPEPKDVRYAWDAFPNVNLYNGVGLPASPFRTDRE